MFEKAQREASRQCFGEQLRMEPRIARLLRTRTINRMEILMIRNDPPQNLTNGGYGNIPLPLAGSAFIRANPPARFNSPLYVRVESCPFSSSDSTLPLASAEEKQPP